MIRDRQRPALGPRPGGGARLLHREGRHGGARRRDAAGDGRLPLAHGGPCRAGGRLDRADGDPRPASDGGGDRGPGARADGARALPAPSSSPPKTASASYEELKARAASSSARRPKSVPTGSTRASATRRGTASASPRFACRPGSERLRTGMGAAGLEPVTSSLVEAALSQLSYAPGMPESSSGALAERPRAMSQVRRCKCRCKPCNFSANSVFLLAATD